MEPNILILVSCQKVIILKSCDINSPLHTPNPSIQAIKRKSFNIFILISLLERNSIYLKFDIRVKCAVEPGVKSGPYLQPLTRIGLYIF